MAGRESGRLTCDLKDVWKALQLQNCGVTPEEKKRIMELAELLQLAAELIRECPPVEKKAGKFDKVSAHFKRIVNLIKN
jgi:hypothetical protein